MARPILSSSIASLTRGSASALPGKRLAFRQLLTLGIGISVAALAPSGNAASATWLGAQDSLWSNALNWSTSPVPGVGDLATFDNAGGVDDVIDLGTGVTLGNLLFDSANVAAYTIGSGVVGAQTLSFSTVGGGITMNSTVVNDQRFNARIALATTGNYNFTNQSTTNRLILAGGISPSAAGASTVTIGGAGNTLLSGSLANGAGTLALTKTGNGTLTLAAANSHTGATSFAANNSGTIVIADVNALATSQLNFGATTGNVVDFATDTSVSPFTSNAGTGFVGTIRSNRATPGAGINHILGNVTYGGGTLNIEAGANVTSGTASVTIPNVSLTSGTANSTLTFNPTTANLSLGNVTIGLNNVAKIIALGGTSTGNTVTGAITNGLNTLSILKTGSGTWTLSGANTNTGAVTVAGGVLNISGSLGTNTTNGNFRVGTVANTTAVLNILPGATINNRQNIFIGDAGAGTGGGAVYQSGGSLTLTQGANIDDFRLGSNAGGYGYYNLSGGTLTANEFGIGASLAGTIGVMDVSGGTATSTNWITLGRGGTTSSGLLNLTGGVVNAGRLELNWGTDPTATSVLNVANAAVNITGAGTGLNLASVSNVTGVQGIANLLAGGTLTTTIVQAGQGSPTAHLNFNGGTLKAGATNAGVNFMSGNNIDAVNVFAGGGQIDNNGTAITVAAALAAPSGSGVSAPIVPVVSGGAGYIGAPLVQFTGGSGSGATGYAVMAGGVVSHVVVTSRGVGYNPGDLLTATFVGGGATTAAVAVADIPVDANVSGGMRFSGSGTTTLTGFNSYTGATLIDAGTLILSGGAVLSGTSGINVNGVGAKLVQNALSPQSAPVTVTNGTLDGTGILAAATIADASGTKLANGDGTAAQFTIGALKFNGAATINAAFTDSSVAAFAAETLTTGAVNASGKVTVNATKANGLWLNGETYDLIRYTNLLGAGFGGFIEGTISGLGARQDATLGNSGAAITLSIAGDVPVWTGALDGRWTTATLANPKNWVLQSAGGATDFISGDVALFGDLTTRTAINISDAPVTITSAIFDHSARDYTISSTGGFGIVGGSITKNGAGTLTISTPNSYTGGTTLNDGTLVLSGNNNFGTGGITVNNGTATISGSNVYSGTTTLNAGALNINHATALGTGTLLIAGGTIDNTSGSAVTLTNNNPQRWTGNLTFTGTNALNLGTGAVTLGADSSAQAIAITNNSALFGLSLTIGGPIAAGAGGTPGVKTLNISGAGTTALTGNITAGAAAGIVINDDAPGTLILSGTSTIRTLNMNGGTASVVDLGAGQLTLANGGGAILHAQMGGTINATGGGSLIIGSANGDFGTAPGSTLTVNAPIAGTNALDLYSPNGALGTVILAGANTHTGAVNVENVRAVVPAGGTINVLNAGNSGQLNVGTFNASRAILELNGGTINATKTAAPSVALGNTAGAAGAIKVSAGTLNSTSEMWVGSIAGTYGATQVSGGTVNVGNWLAVGRNGSGLMDVSGGTVNVTANNFTTGSFTGANGTLPSSFGVVNLTGGTVNVTGTAADQGGFLVGEAGIGNLNVSGTAALNISGARGLHLVAIGNNGTGIANLNGGTVTTSVVQKGAGTGTTSILNFNGGTLRASAANANFLQGLGAAYVNSGGAIIDDGGFAISIGQPLLAPTGNGLSQIVVNGGSDYIAPPLVQITGDGTGATAVANIDANGFLTGITVTNPGVGYTQASANLIGGGGTAGFVEPINLVANTSGGFTKRGAGTVTLAGANTYTGPTIVETGTLVVTGAISGSREVDVKSGATVDLRGNFVLGSGQTLKGSGSVLGEIALAGGAILAPGAVGGTLTFSGNLDVTQAVTPVGSTALRFELGSVANSDKVVFNTGTLSIGSGLLSFNDFTFTTLSGFAAGTYTLFDGVAPINGTLDGGNLSGIFDNGFTGTLEILDSDLVLNVVPEPGSAVLLLAGLGSMLGMRRVRRRAE